MYDFFLKHIEHIVFITYYWIDMEKIYRTEVVFFIKIENFYQKNNFCPKKPSSTPFERSYERIPRHQAKGMENNAL